jgi:hypothetical protein
VIGRSGCRWQGAAGDLKGFACPDEAVSSSGWLPKDLAKLLSVQTRACRGADVGGLKEFDHFLNGSFRQNRRNVSQEGMFGPAGADRMGPTATARGLTPPFRRPWSTHLRFGSRPRSSFGPACE